MNGRDRSYQRTLQALTQDEEPQQPVEPRTVDPRLWRGPKVDRMTREIALELAKIALGYRRAPR
jgi:hypothetical protein